MVPLQIKLFIPGSNEPIAYRGNFIFDTGCTDTFMPGYCDESTVYFCGQEFPLPKNTFHYMVETAGSPLPTCAFKCKIEISVEGLNPVVINTAMFEARTQPHHNAKLLLGLDVISQLSGFWSRSTETEAFLHIENNTSTLPRTWRGRAVSLGTA